MTEASYQQARKLMQQLNQLRSNIKAAKASVRRWSNREMAYRQNFQPNLAEVAKRNLLKALEDVAYWKTAFAAITFPPDNLPPEMLTAKLCRICHEPIRQKEEYCLTCFENQNIQKYDFTDRQNKRVSD